MNRPRIVHSLRDKRIRLLACGGIHTVAVGDDGRVWTWGCNDDGALGRATGPIDPEDMDKGMRGDENMPAVVDGGGLAGQQVELVACGDSHTLALTVDGSVFGWGCYKDKEGRKWFDAQRDNPATFTAKSIKRQQNEPMRIQSLPAGAVTQLSCGATFNACLLRDGQARLWGLGETGELARKVKGWDATPPESTMRNGEGDYLFDQILDQHLTPKAPEMADGSAPPVFKGIGTGMYHTFLIGTSHTVYASGLNNYGQLGLNDEFKQEPGKQPVLVHDKYWQLRPLKDLEGRGVTKIAGGQHHSMALAESAAADDSNPGTIYTWGRSDYGQLGVGDEDIDTGAGDFHNAPIEVSWRGRGGWRSGRADGTHIYVCLAPLLFYFLVCLSVFSHYHPCFPFLMYSLLPSAPSRPARARSWPSRAGRTTTSSSRARAAPPRASTRGASGSRGRSARGAPTRTRCAPKPSTWPRPSSRT